MCAVKNLIHLDTSVLVDAFGGNKVLGPAVRALIARDVPLAFSTLVLYEWMRGPRTAAEIAIQETSVSAAGAVLFETEDARLAADLYRAVSRARSRQIDLAIAATAIRHNAQLWTVNIADFADIPGLRLYRP